MKQECVTVTSVGAVGLETRFTGAEGIGAVYHAVGFVPVDAHRAVAAAVALHVVCTHGITGSE